MWDIGLKSYNFRTARPIFMNFFFVLGVYVGQESDGGVRFALSFGVQPKNGTFSNLCPKVGNSNML